MLLPAAVLFWTACLLSACVAGASRGEDTAYLARETVSSRAASAHSLHFLVGWLAPRAATPMLPP
jgi:hypothetical protein